MGDPARAWRSVLPRVAATGLGLALALSLLELGLWGFGRVMLRQRPAAPWAGAGPGARPLLAVGDSFTHGNGAPAGQDYPSQLEQQLRARYPGSAPRVVRVGLPAYNTHQILSHLEQQRLVERYRPRGVLLLAGGANGWNLKGYRAAADGGLAAGLRDALYGVRVFKLAKLLWRQLREPRRALPPQAETLAGFQARITSRPLGDPCQALPSTRIWRDPAGDFLPRLPPAAARWLQEQLFLHPEDGNLYYGMAERMVREGKPGEARSWLRRGVVAAPGSGVLYFALQVLERSRPEASLGRELEVQASRREANDRYEQVIREAPIAISVAPKKIMAELPFRRKKATKGSNRQMR